MKHSNNSPALNRLVFAIVKGSLCGLSNTKSTNADLLALPSFKIVTLFN